MTSTDPDIPAERASSALASLLRLVDERVDPVRAPSVREFAKA